jgi:RNA polymerase sigma factor for flagellar operon FliA
VTGVSETSALWKRFKDSGDHDARNRLIETYLPLVRYIAERVASKLPRNVAVDDLASAGIFGLIDAIEGFDLSRDVKFETYCSTRVKGAILDELRNLDWVPRLVRSRAHKYERAWSELSAELKRDPSEQELAKRLGVSREEFERILKERSSAATVSLSREWSADDGSKEMRQIDMVADKRTHDPADSLQRRELKGLITKGLSETEKLVMVLYYYEELTMKEIGAVLDISESRVCQIHAEIVRRLHDQLKGFREDLMG